MHNGIAGLLGLSGWELVALICVLIVVEELGVPMPFMPGDFLLVMAGVAITTEHLNLLVVVGAVYVSAVLGAFGGREVFARIGGAVLRRVAILLHVDDRVENIAGRLRRGGSVAVLVGRITPGLRVNTTYVCGLLDVPRHTFLKGLLPGVAVYEGVFVGIGVWLGPAAWLTVERYAPRPSQMLIVLILVVVAVVLGHTCVGFLRKRWLGLSRPVVT
jgi:membrane-associated protein